MSDRLASLLARVSLGDRAAFQQFYELTSSRAYAVALRMLGHTARAEDVLQDVYLKIWHSADGYTSARGTPMSWLISITRNRAIDLMRSKANQFAPLGEETDASATSMTELASLTPQPLDDARLQDCIETLEVEQRQSIFAAFFQGLTHREIAVRFAEPIGTIKSRVRRGLIALRGCLEA